MDDQYLRKLLIVGMTAVIRSARRTEAPGFAWVSALLERRPARLVSVALANKAARIRTQPALACPLLFPMAVWRRIVQDRRGADRRPLDCRGRSCDGAEANWNFSGMLLRMLVAAESVKTAGFGVPQFCTEMAHPTRFERVTFAFGGQAHQRPW